VQTPTSIAPVEPEDRQTPGTSVTRLCCSFQGIETDYGIEVLCGIPAFLQGFKMFLKDSAIRKRRVERAAEMEEQLPEPSRQPTIVSFGPKRSVVRYEMPEPIKQRVTQREGPKKSPPKVQRLTILMGLLVGLLLLVLHRGIIPALRDMLSIRH